MAHDDDRDFESILRYSIPESECRVMAAEAARVAGLHELRDRVQALYGRSILWEGWRPAAMSSGTPSTSDATRCQHRPADLNLEFGRHHRGGPHAWDAGNHGGKCPWWAENGEQEPRPRTRLGLKCSAVS